MKIVDRLALSSLIAKVLPFTARTTVFPILTHVIIRDSKISAYNDMQGIEIESSELEGLNCAIPGDAINRILNTILSDTVDLDINEKQTALTLKFGKNKAKIAILPEDDFIYEFPTVTQAQTLFMSNAFLEAAGLCMTSVSEVPGHPELNTLTIVIQGKNIEMYSTDNKTMSRVTFIDEEAQGSAKLVIPAPFIAQLLDIRTWADNSKEKVELMYNEEVMLVDFGNGVKISTVLVKDFNIINFSELFNASIPDMERIVMYEPPISMRGALERASVFSELKNQKFVQVEADGDSLHFRAESALGRASDVVDLPCEIGEFSFIVDPEVLNRALLKTSHLSILPNLLLTYKKTSSLEFTHLVSYAD